MSLIMKKKLIPSSITDHEQIQNILPILYQKEEIPIAMWGDQNEEKTYQPKATSEVMESITESMGAFESWKIRAFLHFQRNQQVRIKIDRQARFCSLHHLKASCTEEKN